MTGKSHCGEVPTDTHRARAELVPVILDDRRVLQRHPRLAAISRYLDVDLARPAAEFPRRCKMARRRARRDEQSDDHVIGPARASDLIADAKLIRRGRSLACLEAYLYSDGSADPIAHATSSFAYRFPSLVKAAQIECYRNVELRASTPHDPRISGATLPHSLSMVLSDRNVLN